MFYWIDGTPLAGQYSAWAEGEPKYSPDHCVHMYNVLDKLGKWNDFKCNLDKKDKLKAPVVLCQKKYP